MAGPRDPRPGETSMRRVLSLGVVMTVALVGMPLAAHAAEKAPAVHQVHVQEQGSLHGVAQGSDRAPLRNYTVRVRNIADGQIAGTTTTSGAGEFSFAGLQPGSYIVEVVDASGQVVGLSPSLAVTAGEAMTVSINASAAGAITAASASSGFSPFGLRPPGRRGVTTARARGG